jgi:putative DNA primase/helicase
VSVAEENGTAAVRPPAEELLAKAYSAEVLAYFAAHSIDPAVAQAVGVTGANGAIHYPCIDDAGVFERVRALGASVTRQPKGRPLCCWWPAGRPDTPAEKVLVAEGESDALAALTATHRASHPVAQEILAELAVIAVPGASFPVDRLVDELQRVGAGRAILAPDADRAGDGFATRAAEALAAAGIATARLPLPEGRDLADLLGVGDDGADWLAGTIAELESAREESDVVTDPKAERSLARKPSTRELAGQLAAADPYAVGGQQFYVFLDGCYKPGERHLQQQIVELLGHGWSKRKAEEITAFLQITSPELWARPPLGVVNVSNGLLDVETRELGPHTPDHLSPVQVAAAYDPAAACPSVDDFLESTVPDLIGLFMEIVGYLLIPDNRQQKAIMLKGQGGTGKTTALEVLSALLGHENVSTVDLHRLEEDRFATADLYGVLANIFADLPSHALNSSSIFKSITGGDYIRGERKHRDAFKFKPYARLLFSANEAPPTADNSDAFFERWLILPFDRKHRGAGHEDKTLLAKLTTPIELSGLLNKALDGLGRLRRQDGFTSTAAACDAAERFRIDADSAAGFCDENCTIHDSARIAKPALFQAYKAWCDENNRRPVAAVRFGRRLRELHRLDEVASEGRDYWLGIELRDQP